MRVLMLSQADVLELLDLCRLLDALEQGFRALSSGRVEVPARTSVTAEREGWLASMPGYGSGLGLGVKLVTVFPQNHSAGLPSHQALIALFDPATGSPVAVMDGTRITAIRTAGTAAVSVRHLARKDARVLAILGAGVQGQAHLEILPRVRKLRGDPHRLADDRERPAFGRARFESSRRRKLRVRGTRRRRGRHVHPLGHASDQARVGWAWHPCLIGGLLGARRGAGSRASRGSQPLRRVTGGGLPTAAGRLHGAGRDGCRQGDRDGRGAHAHQARTAVARGDHGLQVDGPRRRGPCRLGPRLQEALAKGEGTFVEL